ncbi:MAG: type II toxin-antitoxin system RelE/ParE family toxin [bacterium]|nr:type II toxin-antitoxin system RelE/ParE family toxin [bacterium]
MATLDLIAREPFSSGKKLSGKKKGQYSTRAWPYRIIYMIEKTLLIIIVIDIDHRASVYSGS